MDTLVISGFPGVGKSHFFRDNPNLVVLDSDSSLFSWVRNGVRHPEFPQNYIEHIKANLGKVRVILVSSHKVVRDALRENGIKYVLVYPDKSLKEEYLRRYRARGSDEVFLQMIADKWDGFIDDIIAEEYPTKRVLQSGEYLSDVFREYSYPVICNGLCTSPSDDYCGMHMSNETCPACDVISSKR